MLTHLDQNNNPTMVDVSEKETSLRTAKAITKVLLPPSLREYFVGEELLLKKGPVFQTAIIAGTMAVKRTHELIPFCHQLPIEGIKFEITLNDLEVSITCFVKTTYKTGVEMEALHGASIAALTIYDMCKAVSHDIKIQETKLISKTGGKRFVFDRPVYGLVLTGGKSQRMGMDKALIDYKGKPHALYIHDILTKFCDEVYLSTKEAQWNGTELALLPSITDKYDGTIGGMLTAFETHPNVHWVMVACDLVHFNEETVTTLLSHHGEKMITSFKNAEKGFPEPLCAVYAPKAHELFKKALKEDIRCPVKVLKSAQVTLLDQGAGVNLANINTPEERHAHY